VPCAALHHVSWDSGGITWDWTDPGNPIPDISPEYAVEHLVWVDPCNAADPQIGQPATTSVDYDGGFFDTDNGDGTTTRTADFSAASIADGPDDEQVASVTFTTPCGFWHHTSWDSGQITWGTDDQGNPSATASDATEHIEWQDPCDLGDPQNGTAQLVDVGYMDDSFSWDNGDGTTTYYAVFDAQSVCDGADDWIYDSKTVPTPGTNPTPTPPTPTPPACPDGTVWDPGSGACVTAPTATPPTPTPGPTPTPQKILDVGTPIQDQDNAGPLVNTGMWAHPNDNLSFSVLPASDSDHLDAR
jgi:hypothetical protein